MVSINLVTFDPVSEEMINQLKDAQMLHIFWYEKIKWWTTLFGSLFQSLQVDYEGSFKDILKWIGNSHLYQLMQEKNRVKSNKNQESHYTTKFLNASIVSRLTQDYQEHFHQLTLQYYIERPNSSIM